MSFCTTAFIDSRGGEHADILTAETQSGAFKWQSSTLVGTKCKPPHPTRSPVLRSTQGSHTTARKMESAAPARPPIPPTQWPLASAPPYHPDTRSSPPSTSEPSRRLRFRATPFPALIIAMLCSEDLSESCPSLDGGF